MTSLKSKAGKALAWDLVGNYGGKITGFAISIFLARLLEPEEFGLVGMSLVFIAVLHIFKDMGFASALVQNKNNTSLTYSSVFYLNVAAGVVLTIIIYFSAPLIGIFYKNNQITELVRFFSITFLISSFNIVQQTILRKELNFKILTLRQLISQAIAGIVAIVFAWKGFGVYALVIQQIVAAVVGTVLLWKVSGWYPKLEFSLKEVKKLTGFSVYVFAAQSVNQIIKQGDTLVIGKLFSPSTLGFYSRANSLNSLINSTSVSSITKVFFPTLASIQDDDERFRMVYLKVISIVTDISVYLTGVFFLIGEELIIGLFGEKWEPSVLIFQILILQGFTYPISSMIVNAFMAKGKSKENFKYGNIRKVLQLCPLVIAYFYGFDFFLYTLVIFSIVIWVLNNIFVSRSLKIGLKDQFMVVVPDILFLIISLFGIRYFFTNELNYVLALVQLILFSVPYFLFLYWRESYLLQELYSLFQKAKSKWF